VPSPAPPGSATPTTCRNPEHFSIHPDSIERVETTNRNSELRAAEMTLILEGVAEPSEAQCGAA
jgi:hypothetical protein